MAKLMPWISSVPSVAVDPLIVWMAPKLIGSPDLTVTQPNLSFLQTSVPPPAGGAAAFLPQAAASTTRTPTRANRPSHFDLFILPPSGRRTGPLSAVQTHHPRQGGLPAFSHRPP